MVVRSSTCTGKCLEYVYLFSAMAFAFIQNYFQVLFL